MGSCPSKNFCNTGRQNPQGTQRASKNQTRTENSRRYPLRNLPSTTADQPTYCQVIWLFTLQENNTTFSLAASKKEGDGTSPPSSTGDAQATPELTETATATPESATPTPLKCGKFSLNLTIPTCLEVQELPVDINRGVTLTGSFGTDDNDSTYLESSENSPAIKNKTPDLSALIKKTGNTQEILR